MARTMHRTEADLRAALTTLTERWHEYANYCDKAAARTTNGTLGEIRRERANRPAPTVTGTVGHVGGKQAGGHLNLTTAEAARLQGFPDGYPFQGNKGQRSLQIGNAVPPLLAAHVLAAATGLSMSATLTKEAA